MPTDYSNPKVYTADGRLECQWFVHFRVFDPKSGKRERRKVFEQINRCKTVAERTKAANRLAAKYKKKLQRGWNPFGGAEPMDGAAVSQPPTRPVTGNPIMPTLHAVVKTEGLRLRKKTQQCNQSKLRLFFAWLKANGLERMDVSEFESTHAFAFWDFLSGKRSATRNRYKTDLSQFFGKLKERGLVVANPFSSIKSLPKDGIPYPPFKHHQASRLLAYIAEHDPQLCLAVRMLSNAFVRPGEMRLLKISDIDFEKWTICLRGEISKNKKTQYVTIPPQLAEAMLSHRLTEYPETFYVFGRNGVPGDKPLGTNDLASRHRKAVKVVGLPPEYKFYSWKHTGAVAVALMGTIPIKQLQLQLRHHSLDQTDMYLKSLGVQDLGNLRDNFPDIGM